MNLTYPEEHSYRPGSLSLVRGARALHTLDRPDWLTTTQEAYGIDAVAFTCCWEEEFARTLEERDISWHYKPRTFPVEWDAEGNFVDSFTPDFYLPDLDLFVELVAPDRRTCVAKARKVRMLREQQPGVRIELVTSASILHLLETLLPAT